MNISYMTVIFYLAQVIHASWSDIRKCNSITNLRFIFSYTLHFISNVLHCNAIEQVADFFYNITVKNITDEVYGVGKYESEIDDLIAFTNIRPRCMYDLSKIKNYCHIAYIYGSKDEFTDEILILLSTTYCALVHIQSWNPSLMRL
ncbi:helicase sen1 [Trifolium repens]|nr:helicase sen1 [Trifolium repens]